MSRLDEFLPQDFAIANHYIATHPASHFRQHLVVCRQTEAGRITLSNDTFRCAWVGLTPLGCTLAAGRPVQWESCAGIG